MMNFFKNHAFIATTGCIIATDTENISLRTQLVGENETLATQPGEEISDAFDLHSRIGDVRLLGDLFQSFIDSCSGAALITDAAFRILAANQRGLLLLKAREALGRNVFDFLGSEEAERVREATAKALQSSAGASLDSLLEHSDGARFHSEWRVLPLFGRTRELQALILRLEEQAPAGRPEAELASLALNVSNRAWTEEKLRRANETLRAFIEATPLAMVAIDAEEKIFKWNSAAERLFGWSKSEVLGRFLPFEPSGKPGERLFLLETLRRGEQVTLEAVRRKKGGALAEVSISAAALFASDGIPSGAVAVISDITERKRLEDQLRQAQKMEAVGRLAGGIAHDFNNLLTVITGYDEMLLNSLALDSRARGQALEILRAAEKATALSKQLLAFSRRQVAHPALIDINPVARNMSNMLRRLIGEDIELVMLLEPPLATVRADPNQIEQIILNLVVNARDAMPDGGRITIETGVAELGDEYVQTHFDIDPGRYVCISVTDTGHGMTPKVQSHIFEPFFTTKGLGEGTGLGLSTIYGIVKQNNGSIWLYSEPGKGSTFKIYLPAVDAEPQETSAGSSVILERGSETILLVEDEAGLREMVEQLLEGQGYTVLSAANSYEATQLCSSHRGPVDLLLTDVVMPKTSGQELARRLQTLRRRMRILYMSGYPTETIVRHGDIEPGAAFLEKPFTPEALAKKVRAVLDGTPAIV
jgi:PAS domain S-box-containing protein